MEVDSRSLVSEEVPEAPRKMDHRRGRALIMADKSRPIRNTKCMHVDITDDLLFLRSATVPRRTSGLMHAYERLNLERKD